ncbi:hypothetical protein, partial [Campylobacter helveticus]
IMIVLIFFIFTPLVLLLVLKWKIRYVILIFIALGIFYYTPYSYYLEPSYWEFRRLCKLNELPNNEEKYNKILGYFDTDLDSLDWKELNKGKWKVTNENGYYKKGIYEYATLSEKKQLNLRSGMVAFF